MNVHRSGLWRRERKLRRRERRAPEWLRALPGGGCGCRRRRLGGPAAAGGELADVVEKDGALQGVELRGVERDLGKEGIGHQDCGLVAMAGFGVAQQGRDVDLQGAGEAVERGEGRHGLAVFDLGDVGAGHSHAGSELALGEIANVAEVANCGRYLDAAFLGCGLGDDCQRGGSRLRLFDLEAFVAAAAKRVGGAELHQTAVVTTQYLTLFDGCHHGCHKLSCSEGTQSKDPAHVR